jgi:hypothetical protein
LKVVASATNAGGGDEAVEGCHNVTLVLEQVDCSSMRHC